MLSCWTCVWYTDAEATGGPNPYVQMLEECDALEKFEELQHHDAHEIYEAASTILSRFWGEEGGEQPLEVPVVHVGVGPGAPAPGDIPQVDGGDSEDDEDGPESDADDADAADMMFSFGGGEVNANPFG